MCEEREQHTRPYRLIKEQKRIRKIIRKRAYRHQARVARVAIDDEYREQMRKAAKAAGQIDEETATMNSISIHRRRSRKSTLVEFRIRAEFRAWAEFIIRSFKGLARSDSYRVQESGQSSEPGQSPEPGWSCRGQRSRTDEGDGENRARARTQGSDKDEGQDDGAQKAALGENDLDSEEGSQEAYQPWLQGLVRWNFECGTVTGQ